MAPCHPGGGGPNSAVAGRSARTGSRPRAPRLGCGYGAGSAATAGEGPEEVENMLQLDIDLRLVDVGGQGAPAPVDGLEAAGLVAEAAREGTTRGGAILTESAAAGGGIGGEGMRDTDPGGRAAEPRVVMLTGYEAADAAVKDYTKKNTSHHSSFSGVRLWLFCLVMVLLFGKVGSMYCPDCVTNYNYTWFCPVPKYQFKRYKASIDGWISEPSLVLLEELDTECKVPGHVGKKCRKPSTTVQVVSGFSAAFSMLGTLGPLNIAYQIVHEIEEVDTTRRWLLAYSTFSFFTANFFWVFHLSKENCRNDSNFYPSIIALILNCIYMVFFWYKASGRNPSRKNLLYSALFLVGAIVTSWSNWNLINFCIISSGIIGNCLIFHKIDWKVELYYKIGSIIALIFRALNMIMLLKLLLPRISAHWLQHFDTTPARARILPDMTNGGEPKPSETDTHAQDLTSSQVQDDQMEEKLPSSYMFFMGSPGIQSNGGKPRSSETSTYAPDSTSSQLQVGHMGEILPSSDTVFSMARAPEMSSSGAESSTNSTSSEVQNDQIGEVNSGLNGSLSSPQEKENENVCVLIETKITEEKGNLPHDSVESQLNPRPAQIGSGNEGPTVSFEMRNILEDTEDLACSQPKQEHTKDSGSSVEKSNIQENVGSLHGMMYSQLKQGPQNEEENEDTKVSLETTNMEEDDCNTYSRMDAQPSNK